MKRLLLLAVFVAAVLALPTATGSRSGGTIQSVSKGTALRTNGNFGGPYRNGLIAFARLGNGSALYVIRPDGTGERKIFTPRHDDIPLSPAWSPDGKWIAFVPGAPRKGVWMMRADGSRLHRITIGKGIPQDPTWSPNGKRIAFADRQSPRSDLHDIYVVGTTGSGLRRVASSRFEDSAPVWAPNGGEIVFNRGRNLWRMKTDGSGQRLLARGVGKVSWSPGGSRLAFSRGDPWTMKRDGTDARLVAEVAGDQSDVAWSPDSRWLVTDSVGRGDLMLVRTDGSQIHPLTHASDLYNAWPAWQRLPH